MIFIILGSILLLIVILFIFLSISYSPVQNMFYKVATKSIKRNCDKMDLFTEADIAELPEPVQKYFRYCGYIGKPKMLYMKSFFKDVSFMLSKKGPNVTIDYTTFNSVKKPDRIAFIKTRLHGLPFEGYDSYLNGIGGMKGVIAKIFPIFNFRGPDMDKACLATFLSECLFVPNVALQDYIRWEAIDDTHAKATVNYYNTTVEGTFTFSEKGEMLIFTTDDRGITNSDGSVEQMKWSAICKDYIEVNGYRRPSLLQAVWHYNDGDFIYFDGKLLEIEYQNSNN